MPPLTPLRLCLLGATLAVLVAATLMIRPRAKPTITLERVQAPSLSLASHKSPTPAPAPVPTPAPTAAPVATSQGSEPPVSSVSYEPGTLKAVVAETWPGDDARAFRVIGCESNWNPAARNRSSGALGLWQVMPSWDSTLRQKFGWSHAEMVDPVKATKFAWFLRDSYGWSQWVCK